MRLVYDEEPDGRGSGDMTLIPVVLGDNGDAIIGAGMVCRFMRGGERSSLDSKVELTDVDGPA